MSKKIVFQVLILILAAALLAGCAPGDDPRDGEGTPPVQDTVSPDGEQPPETTPQGDELFTWSATVDEVLEGSLAVSMLSGPVADQPAVLHIQDAAYAEGVSREFSPGHTVTFETTGEIMESYPVQIRVVRFTANAPGEQQIPDLPTVIGRHLGSVPDLILTEDMTTGAVEPDEVFAVALEENVSTGYLWRWEEGDPAVENVLDTRWQPESEEMVGAPGTHIWAFRIGEPGEYALDFTLVAPDGGVGNVQSVTVTVE